MQYFCWYSILEQTRNMSLEFSCLDWVGLSAYRLRFLKQQPYFPPSQILYNANWMRLLSIFIYFVFSFTQAAASIKDEKRIIFQFDRAAFSFKFLPFRVPYPVPFRLLGDEAKGWLDTTYLSQSGNIRISRGNKVNTLLPPFICSILSQYVLYG